MVAFEDLQPAGLGPQVQATVLALAGGRRHLRHAVGLPDWTSERFGDSPALVVEDRLGVGDDDRHAQVTPFPADFRTQTITTDDGATIHVRTGRQGPAVLPAPA